jgi:acyl-CoA synthetase (NDP forming)
MKRPRLTIGRDAQGQLLAVITCGGHPQLVSPDKCEVLDVKVVNNTKEAKEWFDEMKKIQPWESRQ